MLILVFCVISIFAFMWIRLQVRLSGHSDTPHSKQDWCLPLYDCDSSDCQPKGRVIRENGNKHPVAGPRDIILSKEDLRGLDLTEFRKSLNDKMWQVPNLEYWNPAHHFQLFELDIDYPVHPDELDNSLSLKAHITSAKHGAANPSNVPRKGPIVKNIRMSWGLLLFICTPRGLSNFSVSTALH